MKFSILVPKYIDAASNLKETKIRLDNLSNTKNFELDNEESYLFSSDFTEDELCKYIKKTLRNYAFFLHADLKNGHYVEAAIILPYLIKEAKYTSNDNNLIVIRQREKKETQVMIKSSSIHKLLKELDLFFNG